MWNLQRDRKFFTEMRQITKVICLIKGWYDPLPLTVSCLSLGNKLREQESSARYQFRAKVMKLERLIEADL
jgi:hypothetical protein